MAKPSKPAFLPLRVTKVFSGGGGVAKIVYKILLKLQKNLKSLRPSLCSNVATSDRSVVKLFLRILLE